MKPDGDRLQQCTGIRQDESAGTALGLAHESRLMHASRDTFEKDLFAACWLEAPSPEAEVGTVKQYMSIWQDEPACTLLAFIYHAYLGLSHIRLRVTADVGTFTARWSQEQSLAFAKSPACKSSHATLATSTDDMGLTG